MVKIKTSGKAEEISRKAFTFGLLTVQSCATIIPLSNRGVE
jgi:hypothetical protein